MFNLHENFNYYEVLEVKPESPQHEITTAYERARSTYSGDNPAIYTIFSDQEARELLTLVEEAYSILGNKTLRELYDERLFSGRTSKQELSFESLHNASKQNLPDLRKKASKSEFVLNPEMEAKIKSQNDWTGSFLKEVREYKNITIEQMSDTTKVTAFYLNAVEAMEPGNLPAVVFVRGYVNQISKMLGLNEKAVCDSYMKLFKDKLENRKN